MAKSNRVLTVELRLLDVTEEQFEACKELTTNLAADLHASATLLLGGVSRPKVYHYGETYNIDIGKMAAQVEAESNMTGETK
jgi:hypothetical protein